MFDIGWSELLVIGVVAIVVVGPKELPRLMRTFGHYTGKLRAMASDFQRQFEDAVRDSEIDEVRKAMQDFHAQAPTRSARNRRQAADDADAFGAGAANRACSDRASTRAHAQGQAKASRQEAKELDQTRSPNPHRPNPHRPRSRAPRRPRRARREQGRSGGDRGHQGALDGASRRAPAAADLVACRDRRRLRVCFYFSRPLYNLLIWPYRLAAGIDTPIEMIYTAPQEFFFTEMKLALFGAVFIAFPVIASQIYMFVAPGLYRRERKAFLPFLIATPILFLLGAALVYFVVMPLAMTFFLSMQQTGDEQGAHPAHAHASANISR